MSKIHFAMRTFDVNLLKSNRTNNTSPAKTRLFQLRLAMPARPTKADSAAMSITSGPRSTDAGAANDIGSAVVVDTFDKPVTSTLEEKKVRFVTTVTAAEYDVTWDRVYHTQLRPAGANVENGQPSETEKSPEIVDET